jgi:hypothetical protein
MGEPRRRTGGIRWQRRAFVASVTCRGWKNRRTRTWRGSTHRTEDRRRLNKAFDIPAGMAPEMNGRGNLPPPVLHLADIIRCDRSHYIEGLRVSFRNGRPAEWQPSFPTYCLDVGNGELVVVNTCSNRERRIRYRFDIGQFPGRLLLAGLRPMILDPVALG